MSRLTLADWKTFATRPSVLIGWLVLIGAVLWSYASAISLCLYFWAQPDYQHGFIVPLFSIALLLVRGRMVAGEAAEHEDWWFGRLCANKPWFEALYQAPTVWIGAAIGAPTFAVFYAAYLAGVEGPGWSGVALAGLYGAVFGGMVTLVAELVHRGQALQRTSVWETRWAVAFFVMWAALRGASEIVAFDRADEWSVMPFAAGVAVFLGGFRALRWSWPSIVFLYFISPLPGFIEGTLSPLLRKIGTLASIYLIQVTGIPATANGNVIQLPQTQLGVEEACSGIRMLMLFFAICIGASFVVKCPLWKKLVIVVSAVPIAIFSNVMRITVTAILYDLTDRWPTVVSKETAHWVFHDGAGLLMMPLALALLWTLWTLMDRLIIDESSEGPLALGNPLGIPRPGTGSDGSTGDT